MKQKISYHFLWLLVITLSCCDVIDEPIISSGDNYRADLYGEAPTFSELPVDQQFKRVVLEDFTGHHCGNCPPAHIVAHDILNSLTETKVSVVAVHCTGLADPTDAPFTPDYTTTVGDAFWEPFLGFGIPLGRVNRSGGFDFPWTYPQWLAECQAQVAQSPDAVLQLIADYQPANNHLNIHVHSQYLNSLSVNTNLVLLVLESHIVSAQLWYGNNPEVIDEYEHNHMLRGALTGTFGLNDASSPVAGEQITSSFTFDWNNSWNADNCSVLAFLVNNETGEIINSIEKPVVQ